MWSSKVNVTPFCFKTTQRLKTWRTEGVFHPSPKVWAVFSTSVGSRCQGPRRVSVSKAEFSVRLRPPETVGPGTTTAEGRLRPRPDTSHHRRPRHRRSSPKKTSRRLRLLFKRHCLNNCNNNNNNNSCFNRRQAFNNIHPSSQTTDLVLVQVPSGRFNLRDHGHFR